MSLLSGLPDLSTILALVLAGTATVAGWFYKLWQNQKGETARENQRAENEKGKRMAEQASRAAAEAAKAAADERTRQAEERASNGKLDHFETD